MGPLKQKIQDPLERNNEILELENDHEIEESVIFETKPWQSHPNIEKVEVNHLIDRIHANVIDSPLSLALCSAYYVFGYLLSFIIH